MKENIEQNKSLKELNTFGIEAKARWFAEYNSAEELKEVLRSVRSHEGESVKVLHIGGGSNLLFLNDFDGLVLHSAILGIELLDETDSMVSIRVGAGMVWDELVEETLHRGWYGLENLTLIPGEVGAAAVQNIGAYGVEAKDFISQVHLLDMLTLEETTMTREQLCYGYRYSALKSKELWGRYAVLSVVLELSKTFTPQLGYGALQQALSRVSTEQVDGMRLRQVIVDMRNSKLPDPKVLGNAGSFFMNPVVERDVYEEIKSRYDNVPCYEVDEKHVKIPAGWMIEQAGWKGRALGPAGVYERQALVLVNLGGASGQDIVNLCSAVRADVLRIFGVEIHPEVNFI